MTKILSTNRTCFITNELKRKKIFLRSFFFMAAERRRSSTPWPKNISSKSVFRLVRRFSSSNVEVFQITEINGTQSRARAALLKQLEQSTSHHYLSIKRCPSDTMLAKKSTSVAPVKKKAKSERGTITAFFNEKKKKDEVVEVKPVKRPKKAPPPPPPVINEPNLISTVQVEKASLILFDEVRRMPNCFFIDSACRRRSDRNVDE